MNIVLLGRPGSGKGTQGERLAAALDVVHLSTGQLLRDAVEMSSALGRSVRHTVETGGLVDDATMAALLAYAVADASSGFVLDGYPRTLSQCEALEEVFGVDGIDLALEIDVPAHLVVDRLRARGRADDDPEVVLRRLWEYERQTRVVSDWFERQARLVCVDGTGTADVVAADVLTAVNHWFDRLEAFA